jgi:competence protein ComEA
MIPSTWTLREKVILSLFALFILVFVVSYFFRDENILKKENNQSLTNYTPVKEKTESKSNTKTTHIMIDVKGAVKRPGIYRLPAESRIYQAIQTAGGFNAQADQKQLNLAQICQDEMVVYVPVVGETPLAPPGQEHTFSSGQQKLNINTATVEQLEALDSIGPAKAEAIIKYREEHGPFASLDALTEVPGIGEKTLEKFREQLVLR